jgi:hypothetical protein
MPRQKNSINSKTLSFKDSILELKSEDRSNLYISKKLNCTRYTVYKILLLSHNTNKVQHKINVKEL